MGHNMAHESFWCFFNVNAADVINEPRMLLVNVQQQQQQQHRSQTISEKFKLMFLFISYI